MTTHTDHTTTDEELGDIAFAILCEEHRASTAATTRPRVPCWAADCDAMATVRVTGAQPGCYCDDHRYAPGWVSISRPTNWVLSLIHI